MEKEKRKEAKREKQTEEIGGKKCKRSSQNELIEVPEEEEREELIRKAHEETLHGGVKGAYEKQKEKYYWVNMGEK
ncbi:hypothetical protein NEFER03_1913 [Nematocida sp. LUAm3]|nr:hypothetical protein NEFER03_1913 [Nematocida sp. LUAm3]KAI5176445.1 hypothetical protein NEFER02_2200 [Nematocida sp. LUAm2]KAI5179323.1 hypothetical protein NEFER01_2167 [Nematocida sp. LUAm1]